MTQHCERCGAQTLATTVSYFSTERICMDCKDLERQHPAFKRAEAIEIAHVKAGDMSFPGIGTPSDLMEQSRQARIARESQDQ